jgi:hypothetical protein
MKKSLTVLLLSAALASGADLFAQAPPVSTTLRVRGTIDKYDAASRTLSLSTASGTLRLPLAPTTRISQEGHKVEALALQKLAGDRATVRYTDSDCGRIVESVHVFGK